MDRGGISLRDDLQVTSIPWGIILLTWYGLDCAAQARKCHSLLVCYLQDDIIPYELTPGSVFIDDATILYGYGRGRCDTHQRNIPGS